MPMYKFICPECNKEKEINMKISEYKSDGHICECGGQLKRSMKDTAKDYVVHTTGFYGKNSGG